MFAENDLIFIAPERRAAELSKGQFACRIWVLALAEPLHGAANREFLGKVLAAANLNLEKDTLFAEIPVGEPVTFSTDIKDKQPEHILVFGLSPAQLGLTLNMRPYTPFSFYGATWLFADALSALEPDKTRKGQLWSALKQLFF